MVALAEAMTAMATQARTKLRIFNLLLFVRPTQGARRSFTTDPGRLCRWLRLPLVQIVVGRAHLRACGRGVGIEAFLGDDDNAAILAHLDDVEAAGGALVHPVLALELGDDAFDRAFDAERLAAAHARERLFLFEHACRRGGGAEIDPRDETDHFLRAGCLA